MAGTKLIFHILPGFHSKTLLTDNELSLNTLPYKRDASKILVADLKQWEGECGEKWLLKYACNTMQSIILKVMGTGSE